MKNSIQILVFLLVFGGIFMPEQGVSQSADRQQLLSHTAMSENEPLLRHVVLFAFKEDATEQDIREIEEAFSALPGKIPEIKDYEWGTNNSPEGINDGLTHCFLVTFASEEDRAIYLPHPEHQAFVKILRPHLEKVVVVDYWTNE